MPVIKVDLPQEVLEKLATLANRHMVTTRVMAGDVIAAYLNAAQQSFAPDAPPESCEYGNLRGKCPVEICSYSKHGGYR